MSKRVTHKSSRINRPSCGGNTKAGLAKSVGRVKSFRFNRCVNIQSIKDFPKECQNKDWKQLGLNIVGEAAYDYSGKVSLSSDGNTVAIGAIYNDGNGTYSGHVRVFTYINGNWTQLGLDIDGENSRDFSGNSVSLSSDGSTVAIGVPFNDGNGTNSGHVRVFRYSKKK